MDHIAQLNQMFAERHMDIELLSEDVIKIGERVYPHPNKIDKETARNITVDEMKVLTHLMSDLQDFKLLHGNKIVAIKSWFAAQKDSENAPKGISVAFEDYLRQDIDDGQDWTDNELSGVGATAPTPKQTLITDKFQVKKPSTTAVSVVSDPKDPFISSSQSTVESDPLQIPEPSVQPKITGNNELRDMIHYIEQNGEDPVIDMTNKRQYYLLEYAKEQVAYNRKIDQQNQKHSTPHKDQEPIMSQTSTAPMTGKSLAPKRVAFMDPGGFGTAGNLTGLGQPAKSGLDPSRSVHAPPPRDPAFHKNLFEIPWDQTKWTLEDVNGGRNGSERNNPAMYDPNRLHHGQLPSRVFPEKSTMVHHAFNDWRSKDDYGGHYGQTAQSVHDLIRSEHAPPPPDAFPDELRNISDRNRDKHWRNIERDNEMEAVKRNLEMVNQTLREFNLNARQQTTSCNPLAMQLNALKTTFLEQPSSQSTSWSSMSSRERLIRFDDTKHSPREWIKAAKIFLEVNRIRDPEASGRLIGAFDPNHLEIIRSALIQKTGSELDVHGGYNYLLEAIGIAFESQKLSREAAINIVRQSTQKDKELLHEYVDRQVACVKRWLPEGDNQALQEIILGIRDFGLKDRLSIALASNQSVTLQTFKQFAVDFEARMSTYFAAHGSSEPVTGLNLKREQAPSSAPWERNFNKVNRRVDRLKDMQRNFRSMIPKPQDNQPRVYQNQQPDYNSFRNNWRSHECQKCHKFGHPENACRSQPGGSNRNNGNGQQQPPASQPKPEKPYRQSKKGQFKEVMKADRESSEDSTSESSSSENEDCISLTGAKGMQEINESLRKEIQELKTLLSKNLAKKTM